MADRKYNHKTSKKLLITQTIYVEKKPHGGGNWYPPFMILSNEMDWQNKVLIALSNCLRH